MKSERRDMRREMKNEKREMKMVEVEMRGRGCRSEFKAWNSWTPSTSSVNACLCMRLHAG